MRLIVYRQRGSYFAKHPEDEYTLVKVEPMKRDDGKRAFLCTSIEEARRLGYKGES